MYLQPSSNEIVQLESSLERLIKCANLSFNIHAASSICKVINNIIAHDDFEQLSSPCCQYYRMRHFWLQRLFSLQND